MCTDRFVGARVWNSRRAPRASRDRAALPLLGVDPDLLDHERLPQTQGHPLDLVVAERASASRWAPRSSIPCWVPARGRLARPMRAGMSRPATAIFDLARKFRDPLVHGRRIALADHRSHHRSARALGSKEQRPDHQPARPVAPRTELPTQRRRRSPVPCVDLAAHRAHLEPAEPSGHVPSEIELGDRATHRRCRSIG
jgi:hypothetical protein